MPGYSQKGRGMDSPRTRLTSVDTFTFFHRRDSSHCFLETGKDEVTKHEYVCVYWVITSLLIFGSQSTHVLFPIVMRPS